MLRSSATARRARGTAGAAALLRRGARRDRLAERRRGSRGPRGAAHAGSRAGGTGGAAGRARTSSSPSGRRISGTMPGRSACRAAGSSPTMPARQRRRCARRSRRSASTRPRSTCWAACATTTPSPAFASTRSSAGSSRRWSYTLDPFEVAEAFELPHELRAWIRSTIGAKAYERNGERRHFYVLPYQGRHIWGATAGILVNFARLLAD